MKKKNVQLNLSYYNSYSSCPLIYDLIISKNATILYTFIIEEQGTTKGDIFTKEPVLIRDETIQPT